MNPPRAASAFATCASQRAAVRAPLVAPISMQPSMAMQGVAVATCLRSPRPGPR